MRTMAVPMAVHLLASILLWTLVTDVDGYARGAPDSACSNLMPGHGPNGQTSPPPFSVTPLQVTVTSRQHRLD